MTRVKLMEEGDKQLLNAIQLATGYPMEKLMHEAVAHLRKTYLKEFVAPTNGKK